MDKVQMTPSCETGSSACASGYTLLELLVVLAIMAFAGLVVVGTSASGTEQGNVRSVGVKLGSILVDARLAAIREGRPVSVSLVGNACAMQMNDNSIPLGCRGGTVVRASKPRSRAGGDGETVFFSDGSSSGGNFSVSGEAFGLDVRPDWLTGEVRIGEPVRAHD